MAWRLTHDLDEYDAAPVLLTRLPDNAAALLAEALLARRWPVQAVTAEESDVTVSVSRAALDAGAADVVLLADLANPASNALYQRLGYRPVEDRVTLGFGS